MEIFYGKCCNHKSTSCYQQGVTYKNLCNKVSPGITLALVTVPGPKLINVSKLQTRGN